MVDHLTGTCLLLCSWKFCANPSHSNWPCSGGICQPKWGASWHAQWIGPILPSTGICSCSSVILWGVTWSWSRTDVYIHVSVWPFLLQTVCFSVSGDRLTNRLRHLAYKAIMNQEIGWHSEEINSSGGLVSRLSQDAASVQGVSWH